VKGSFDYLPKKEIDRLPGKVAVYFAPNSRPTAQAAVVQGFVPQHELLAIYKHIMPFYTLNEYL
jgi:hypothetical protein